MPETDCLTILNEIITDLGDSEYWNCALIHYNLKINELAQTYTDENEKYIVVLDHLTDILRNSEPQINEIIRTNCLQRHGTENQEKFAKCIHQASMTVAGTIFARLVIYALIQNVIHENILPLIITSRKKPTLIRRFFNSDFLTIGLGNDEKQTPDADILIFNPEDISSPVVILSSKTSLRERAGQTYKWKLLYEFATCQCQHTSDNPSCPITKLGIRPFSDIIVKVGFVTADLYNETNSPQNSGMFAFFDFAYVSQQITARENLKPLSKIVEDINFVFDRTNQ